MIVKEFELFLVMEVICCWIDPNFRFGTNIVQLLIKVERLTIYLRVRIFFTNFFLYIEKVIIVIKINFFFIKKRV